MLTFSWVHRKTVATLSDREVLALAIQSEEEDERVYREFAFNLHEKYPASAAIFERMASEETDHRRRLLDLFAARFPGPIPLIRRDDVDGFDRRAPVWTMNTFDIDAVRHRAEQMEAETTAFYRSAAARATDPEVRKLLGDLADVESEHEDLAARMESGVSQDTRHDEKAAARRSFVLQIVQPGLAGLMDGSVSTLAPVFAAAFATRDSWDAFLVGLAASIGAGISMGFAEAMSDDGRLSGRGQPLIRGAVCGLMTALGGIGHTLPYLIHDFTVATSVAVAVVVVELIVIAWIRARYMDTPFLRAAFQVIVGGVLVFITGILIGSA
jgi:rubrerythrin